MLDNVSFAKRKKAHLVSEFSFSSGRSFLTAWGKEMWPPPFFLAWSLRIFIDIYHFVHFWGSPSDLDGEFTVLQSDRVPFLHPEEDLMLLITWLTIFIVVTIIIIIIIIIITIIVILTIITVLTPAGPTAADVMIKTISGRCNRTPSSRSRFSKNPSNTICFKTGYFLLKL